MKQRSAMLAAVGALLAAAPARAQVKLDKVPCLGHPDCDRLSNGTVDLVAPNALGPRIIRYGFAGQDSVFGETAEVSATTELGEWKPVGGHRLWHAPEGMPRSYSPDNAPVERELSGSTLRLRQAVEPRVGIQKEIAVDLDPTGTHVTVRHSLTNRSLWPVELAPWAMTIMSGGGTVILPQEPYVDQSHQLLPARPLVLWSYTDLTDPRYAIGAKYIRVRVMADRGEPQKIGIGNRQGWAAYHRGRTLFLKRFPYDEAARYTDFGSNCETYVRSSFVELESLGPLKRLEPGASAEHVEQWYLFEGVDIGSTEAALEAALKPLLPQTMPR